MTLFGKPGGGVFRPRVLYPVLAVLGLLPVIPLLLKGSPVLNNDMLVAYFCYFWDFHKNWSWSQPLVFWSSSYQCGMPMHAYWQSGYLYPVTWILFGPLSPHYGIYLFYAFHFALGVFGLLRLGPRLGLTRPASLWAGLCFSLSGTMLARYEHATFLSGWAWMPLVLAAFLALRDSPGPASVFRYALAVALQALGGHPQASATTALLIAAYTVSAMLRSPGADRVSRSAETADARTTGPRRSLWLWGGHMLALLYCAPMLYPFVQLVGETSRYDGADWEQGDPGAARQNTAADKLETGVFRFEKFSTGGMRPLHLLSLGAPHALGSPSNASWWGGEVWGEVFLYLGGLGFCFCFFASWKRARRDMRLLWLMGLFGLWLAFGAHLGASQILYHVPVFNNFRRPARFVILLVLALAVLSGHGFQRWTAKGRGRGLPRALALGALGGGALLFALGLFPGILDQGLEWVKSVKPLDPAKDYTHKLMVLAGRWAQDAGVLALSAAALWAAAPRPRARMPLLFLILAADLLRLHWDHFYLFPRAFYREPPASVRVLDEPSAPFWRVAHYLEYPGLEMWQMHNDPLAHPDLFEREKLSLSCGIHAVFGYRHVTAHLPLLWNWEAGTGPAAKSTRYLFTNRELSAYQGSPLRPLGRFGGDGAAGVHAYELADWRPRIALVSGALRRPGSGDSLGMPCPEGYSGHGLCVREVRDGDLRIRGGFGPGDTVLVRERYHREWRYRAGNGSWRKPLETPEHFLALPVHGEAELQLQYFPRSFWLLLLCAVVATAALCYRPAPRRKN